MFALLSTFIMARTDHGAGVNTCWGPGNCLPPDAARCGAGFNDCSACNLAPSTGAHCWGHAASLVNGESFCNSQIVPGTHGIPSNACSDPSIWDAHQIVQCHMGEIQRYCNSGYVLRRNSGQARCDESTEHMPTTYNACQQAATAMNRGILDYTGSEGSHGQSMEGASDACALYSQEGEPCARANRAREGGELRRVWRGGWVVGGCGHLEPHGERRAAAGCGDACGVWWHGGDLTCVVGVSTVLF